MTAQVNVISIGIAENPVVLVFGSITLIALGQPLPADSGKMGLNEVCTQHSYAQLVRLYLLL